MKRFVTIMFAALALAGVCGAAWAGGGGSKARPTGQKQEKAPAANGVHVDFTLNDKPVTVTVSGRVTDATTGRPIANAWVRGMVFVVKYMAGDGIFDPTKWEKLSRAEAQTDRSGRYALTFTTSLTVSGWSKGKDSVGLGIGADGYESRPLWVKPNVTPDKLDFTGVDIPLRRGRHMTGSVVDESGRPVEGAMVSGGGGGSGSEQFICASGRTFTDAAGAFSMWVARTDTSNYGAPRYLEISKPGIGFLYVLPLDKDDLGKLTLPRGAAAAGRVVDTSGNGVADCGVLFAAYWSRPIRTKTDANGYYRLEGLQGVPSLTDMRMRLSGYHKDYSAVFSVWARMDPQSPLLEAPSYRFTPEDGKTFTGPDLVIGRPGISGTVIATNPNFNLKGLDVALDGEMGPRAEVDEKGQFTLPDFPTPGMHRLTAYYHNRGDAHVGTVLIEAAAGKALEGIQLPLYPLAEAKVQFIDARGNPVEGIKVSARSTLDDGAYSGFGGTSDASGQTSVFLWPGARLYVSGWDPDKKLFCSEYPVVTPAPLEALGYRITMVAPSAIKGRLTTGGRPIPDRDFRVWIHYADDDEGFKLVHTDAGGRFETLFEVRPGVAKLTVESDSEDYLGSTKTSLEIAPGQTLDFGDISLQPRRLFTVHGTVIPSKTYTDTLGGFVVFWNPDRPHTDGTDAKGEFDVGCVPEGRHRFSAYLRFGPASKLMSDLGHADVYVGSDIKNLQVRLDPMATVNVEIVNEAGEPLFGMYPAAWTSPDPGGAHMEGRECDVLGKAILYVTPDKPQFVGAIDPMGQYSVKEHKEVNLKPGEISDAVVVMKHN